ncbi:hypothetical protein BDZ89DRAFT_723423 [Hymenopellis radicata]|nr:hypothetical protein BDZ89DRAFT_723423 [Hymenopellis radicata]
MAQLWGIYRGSSASRIAHLGEAPRDPKSLRFSSSTVEDLDEIQGLLEQVLVLAPHLSATLIDSRPEWRDTPTDIVLGHPGLLASNVIVPHLTPNNAAERMNTLTYTHWQGAAVLPFPLHIDVPPIIRYDGELFELPDDPRKDIEWPSNMGTLSQEQQDVVRTHHHLATRHTMWVREMLESKFYPFIFAYAHDLYPAISYLSAIILRACSDGPWTLRGTLIRVYQDWDTEQWGPCPISFSEEELAANMVDIEEHARCHHLTAAARKQLGCDVDGWVPNGKYDEASTLLAEIRTEWLARHSNTPFPFTDGAWSSSLS